MPTWDGRFLELHDQACLKATGADRWGGLVSLHLAVFQLNRGLVSLTMTTETDPPLFFLASWT